MKDEILQEVGYFPWTFHFITYLLISISRGCTVYKCFLSLLHNLNQDLKYGGRFRPYVAIAVLYFLVIGYWNIDDRHRNPNINIREIIWLGNQLDPIWPCLALGGSTLSPTQVRFWQSLIATSVTFVLRHPNKAMQCVAVLKELVVSEFEISFININPILPLDCGLVSNFSKLKSCLF